MLKAQKYSEWAPTAWALHMVLQMMGKTKLALSYPEPEWNHSLLELTPEGFTTGVIPSGGNNFSISINLRASNVSILGVNGESYGFSLQDSKSVSGYFASFNYMLDCINVEADISPIPQEVADQTPFDKQGEQLEWDQKSALNYLYSCHLAHNAIQCFVAPLRCKKINPKLFWGTYDLTAILFSGKDAPYDKKGYIEEAAFDEQLVECGFWPGDPGRDQPTYFALSYPMDSKKYTSGMVRPPEATYDETAAEFFLSLSDVLKSDSPFNTVKDFFTDAFTAYAENNWENLDWFKQPLTIR